MKVSGVSTKVSGVGFSAGGGSGSKREIAET